MPELPEVEATRRYLVALGVVETRITGVTLGWPKAVQGVTSEEFSRRLTGRTILDARRRAKYLFFPLDVDTLVIHLRMTGSLEVAAPPVPVRSQPTATINLSTGQELRFYDSRRLGKLWLVDDLEPLFANLGPEPLEPSFTLELLKQRIGRRRAPIKPVLLEQGAIAGIGNIYADEILFCAGVHPTRPASELMPNEMERLHGCIVAVLRDATEVLSSIVPVYTLQSEAQHDREELHVPRQEGVPCIRCDTPVQRLVLRGRSAYFCPRCQG
jgi:formamidopyrimidine-DNA glycosylase